MLLAHLSAASRKGIATQTLTLSLLPSISPIKMPPSVEGAAAVVINRKIVNTAEITAPGTYSNCQGN